MTFDHPIRGAVVARRALRRAVHRGCLHDRHLLPSELPGASRRSAATSASSAPPRRPTTPASAPASAASPTPCPAPPTGTCTTISPPAPCGSCRTASSSARASTASPAASATRRATSRACCRPSSAPARSRSPVRTAPRPPAPCSPPPICPICDIAFAAGFGSLRQFNDTMSAVYRATPSELRAIARRGSRGHGPIAGGTGQDAGRAASSRCGSRRGRRSMRPGCSGSSPITPIAGLEQGDDSRYERTLMLPGGRAEVVDHPRLAAPGRARHGHGSRAGRRSGPGRASTPHVRSGRRLGRHRRALSRRPGARAAHRSGPRHPDRRKRRRRGGAVPHPVGQQISVAAARTVLGRLVADLGGRRRRAFPSAATIAEHGRGRAARSRVPHRDDPAGRGCGGERRPAARRRDPGRRAAGAAARPPRNRTLDRRLPRRCACSATPMS